MLQGAEGHRNVQRKRKEDWLNEVYVRFEIENIISFMVLDVASRVPTGEGIIFDMSVAIQGRIDGVLITDDIVVIEEIKTYLTSYEPKVFKLTDFFDEVFWFDNLDVLTEYQFKFSGLSFLHVAQVLIYSFIYLKNNNLKEILCRLNYVRINSGVENILDVVCSEEFLDVFFKYTFSKWLEHHVEYGKRKLTTKESLLALNFPFAFRGEQRKMAVAVYRNIVDGTNLYSRAPTGTGKTLAAIYPALKAMGEEKTEKIFYLTAKTIGRTVAEKTVQILQKSGGDLRYCVITAKEKACLKEFALCDPEYCEYTIDYHKKQKKAMKYALESNRWNYDFIQSIALEYELCPFELSLGLSQYAEIVICDYNYAFEPNVYIRRHFDGLNHSYTFLIDEAHNLTDRAREMYSKEINSEDLSNWINDFPHKKLKIYKKLVELYETVENIAPLDKEFFVLNEYPAKIIALLDTIVFLIEKQLDKKNKAFLKFYLIKIYWLIVFILANIRGITANHIIYYKRDTPIFCSGDFQSTSRGHVPMSRFVLKVFCVNPRDLLAEYLKSAKSSTFFSATLHPFDYFCEIFAERENDNRLTLLSPFKKEMFGLYLFTGINTMYQFREQSYQPLADLIIQSFSVKKGNYIVYFPSFSFMKQVYDLCRDAACHVQPRRGDFQSSFCSDAACHVQNPNNENCTIVCQKPRMSEKEREGFLQQFDNQDQHLIAFAVLGGIFSEGIDLIGSKLIGCMIITVGIPGLGGENDLIKDYYELENHKGFEFAYRYPGFNNVMQAAGRVIRSEEDKGIVVLVDQRFTKAHYKELFPPDWSHYKVFMKLEKLRDEIEMFWG